VAHPRRAGAVVWPILALVLAAGCTPAAAPAPTAWSASAPPASASPRVHAATGPNVVRGALALRLPASFATPRKRAGAIVAPSRDACAAIQVAEYESRALTLSDFAETYRDAPRLWSSKPERLPDVTIAGSGWFHLHGYATSNNDSDDANLYGTYREGHAYTITLVRTLLNECGLPAADIEAEWASVLATVRWR
jgi:hypothetical protein